MATAGASVSARLVRGGKVYASTKRSVQRGSASMRLRARRRIRSGHYRLRLTFTDASGKRTVLERRTVVR